MNFPLFKTFKVSPFTTSFLNKKFDEYKKEHESFNIRENSFNANNGYQTENLLNWKNKKFKKFIKYKLSKLISSQLKLNESKIDYHWIHFLDYYDGGSMNYHKHSHNEDFVLFIYLKNCKSGETVFHLNDHCQEYADRTEIRLLPKKNLGSIFSSLVMHKGEHTSENKRIFVVGIKVNLLID